MDRYVTALVTFAGTFGVLGPAWALYVRHIRKKAQSESPTGTARNKMIGLAAICSVVIGGNAVADRLDQKYWTNRVNEIHGANSDDFCKQVQVMYDNLPKFLTTAREVVGQHLCSPESIFQYPKD